MNEALRDWVTNVHDTYYMIGTAAGPHPYPARVRDFQSVIGAETRGQMLEMEGRLPDAVMACVGGGLQRHRHVPPLPGRRGRAPDRGRGFGPRPGQAARRLHHRRAAGGAARQQDLPAAGRRRPDQDAHSISAGLDYPGIGPEHAWLHGHRPGGIPHLHRRRGPGRVPAVRRAGGRHPPPWNPPTPSPAWARWRAKWARAGSSPCACRAAATRTWPPWPPPSACRSNESHALTTQRLDACFARLKAEGRSAFVAYVMAGDPDAQTALEIVRGLPAAGPTSSSWASPSPTPCRGAADPARGAAGAEGRMTLNGTLDLVRQFRAGDQATAHRADGLPQSAPELRLRALRRRGGRGRVDGLIVVDCPPEEADPLADPLDLAGVSLIRLATPTTDEHRLPTVIQRTSGFIYYVSVAGVTGVKEADAEAVRPAVERLRKASGLPVAVGFGVRTPRARRGRWPPWPTPWWWLGAGGRDRRRPGAGPAGPRPPCWRPPAAWPGPCTACASRPERGLRPGPGRTGARSSRAHGADPRDPHVRRAVLHAPGPHAVRADARGASVPAPGPRGARPRPSPRARPAPS